MPARKGGHEFFAEIGKTGLTNAAMRGIIYLAFAGVAHLVERDLAKVEVASSSLVARSKKNTPSDRMGYSFWNAAAPENSLPRPARSAANRSVGDGVPDVPSARRCRAGNGFPRRFTPRSKCPWGTPRNDRGVGLSTRCHHPTGWCFFSYSARRNSGFRSRRPSSAAAICPSRASRSPLRVPFSVR